MSTPISIDVCTAPDRTVLVVAGELDIASAPSLAERLEACLDTPGACIELDLSRVTFFGSAGIRTLLEYRGRALASGSAFRVVNPSRAVQRVLTGHVREVLVGPRAETQTKELACLTCDTTTPHVPGPDTIGSDGSVLVRWWSCTKCDEGYTIP